MRLLKYKGDEDRRPWRLVDGEGMRRWREKVADDLMNTDGRVVRFESDVAHTRGLEAVDRDDAGVPVLERPARGKPLQPRETTEELAKIIADQWLTWKQTNPDLFRRKLAEAKSLGALSHLTDEQAEEQILSLCRKVAESHARRTYEKTAVLREHFYQGEVVG